MEEKKYLKWYNKVGYGAGDWASNMVYALMSSFVMIYLTDTVGLNAGIIGTLIMISKLTDGISDVFFGNIIDKTHNKMGKARPWMLWSFIGNAVCLIALFAVPASLGEKAQYVYFFITYTLLNTIFYTANNIAYASLTSLITRNNNERVQIGSIRFMFALATTIIVSAITVNLVGVFGGGAAGWRNVATIYAIIGLIVNTISVLSVRELPEEELALDRLAEHESGPKEKISLKETFKLLLANKYYLMIAGLYICLYVQQGVSTGVGIYYMTYIFGNPSLLGTFTMMGYLPMIIGLVFTPMLVKKARGIFKVNLIGYILTLVFKATFVIFGYMGNIPLMLASLALMGICASPLTGDLNALISISAEYTFLKSGKHIEGSMFSCSSLGIKIGVGVGTALAGWLLSAGGYVPNAAQQSASCVGMMQFLYLWFPFIVTAIMVLLLRALKVEEAVAALKNETL